MTPLMTRLCAMLLIVAVGWAAVKLRVLRTEDSRVLSRLLLYILQPCLVTRAFLIELTPARMSGFLAAAAFTTVIYVFEIILLRSVRRPLGLDGVDRATLIYSNIGNLVLPLIQTTLGTEYVFYISALQIPFNLFIWTHAVKIIGGGTNLKKALTSPPVVAVFIGLILLFSGIALPPVPDAVVGTLADMVGGLSMLSIGMTIASYRLKDVFLNGRAYLLAAGRLLVMPLIMLGVLWASRILVIHPEWVSVFQVVVIALSAPTAATVAQLAILHNKRPVDASIYNMLSTVLYALSLPLVLYIYSLLFS